MVAGLGGDAEANKKTVGDLTKLMKKEGPALLAELIPSINGLSEEVLDGGIRGSAVFPARSRGCSHRSKEQATRDPASRPV